MSEHAQATARPNITIHKCEQGTSEWHDLRRGLITASAIGKLITPTLKVADNETSRGLALTLAAERLAGFTEETPMNADMYRGRDVEPYARDWYSAHYQQAEEVGFITREFDGVTIGYSPDGLVGVDGLIEVKAPRSKTHVATTLADEVPAQYVAQCQTGLFVSGRDWCDFISYVGGMPPFVKRVYPDPDWFAVIEEAAHALEARIGSIVADYTASTRNLPATERINFNIVELEL